MGLKLVTPHLDLAVVGLARGQHWVVIRAQLVALGLSDRAIARRVAAGRLYRVYRGVYAVGHPDLTMHGRFTAAVLACGDGAALSHRSAAVLWGLHEQRGPRIDVTVPKAGGRRNRRALIVHRAKLRAEEVTTKDGIRVTTPARTILDRAGVVARRELERTLDEAAYLGLDLSELAPRQGRRGSALLAAVQAEHDAGSTRTRSEVEERMLALCRRFRLPTPEVNRKVESYTADFLWRHARLIVETDGWQGHGHREAFERDRVRDAALTVAGWRVMRVTWRRLTRDPGRVAAQLGRLL